MIDGERFLNFFIEWFLHLWLLTTSLKLQHTLWNLNNYRNYHRTCTIIDIINRGRSLCEDMFDCFVGTARIVCAAGFVEQYGVRPSVCPIRPLQQRAEGLLLWARRVGDIDRLLHGRRRSSKGPQHGARQWMRVVPRFQRTSVAEHRLVYRSRIRI